VTAVGGGTIRDLVIGAPPFWIADSNYLLAAAAGALVAFVLGGRMRAPLPGVLYADGLGAALFAVTATEKSLAMQLPGSIAILMGVLTGIGGGLIRDVLAGRPTLLMSRDIYATPILLGCISLVGLRNMAALPYSAATAAMVIFGIRALAIYRHLEMPLLLTHQPRHDA
jgi:uncharacterized membrane protein YeiH